MERQIKACPYCGIVPTVIETPLWKGKHGCIGDYAYSLGCKTENCPMRYSTANSNTLGAYKEHCVPFVIDSWNRMVDVESARTEYRDYINNINKQKE